MAKNKHYSEIKKVFVKDKESYAMKIFEQVNIFSKISNEDGIQKLFRANSLMVMDTEEYIIAEGDIGVCAYIILSGSVEVSRKSLSRDDIVVAAFSIDYEDILKTKAKEFPLLGEHSLVGKDPRTATVKATSPTVVLRINFSDFSKVIEAFPKIGVHVFREICYMLQNRLKTSNNNVVALFDAYLSTMKEDLMEDE